MSQARSVALAAIAVLACSLGFVGVRPAVADVPVCSARAVMPSRVLIDRQQVSAQVLVTSDCTGYWIVRGDYVNRQAGQYLDLLGGGLGVKAQTLSFHAPADLPGRYDTEIDDELSGTDTGPLTWISTSITFKYVSYVYLVTTRVGHAVYAHGLVQNYSNVSYTHSPSGLVRGAGRTVYLQRYIAGQWQNVLARTADFTGQLSIGFIQAKVFRYRLAVLENSTSWNGYSVAGYR